MLRDPVPYSPSVETFAGDETRTIHALNAAFDEILQTTASDYGHAVRAVHAKAHGILLGRMRVLDGLAPELAQGLFARPGIHEVHIRLSTNAGDILPDAVSLPRGLAMKVRGADGPRLDEAEGDSQDFILVNGKTFQAKDTEAFLSSLKLIAKTTDRMENTKKVMSRALQAVNHAMQGLGIESSTVQALGGAPNVHPLGETYYSVTPFRYGDYIAKFSLVPVSDDLAALAGREIDIRDRDNALREDVRADMARTSGTWEFRVQLCRDLDRQPVEDPTTEWDESAAPFQTVAVVTVEPQDSWDASRVRSVDEQMRFSIWTGLAAHQPLGNINRARKDTYRHSAAFRAGFNRCPIHEPGTRGHSGDR